MNAPDIGIRGGLAVQSRQGLLPVGLSVLSSAGKRQLGLPDQGLVVGQVLPGTRRPARVCGRGPSGSSSGVG